MGIVVGLGVLLAGLVLPLSPGAAAATTVTCPAGITEWKFVGGKRPGSVVQGRPAGSDTFLVNTWDGYRYTLVSAVPQFLVSDGRILDNTTNGDATFTVTSQIQRSYSISATTGITANNVRDFLNINVSSTIQAGVTTSLGVTVSTTVPAHTRMIAEYGVDVYQVSYYIEAWRVSTQFGTPPPPPGTGNCQELGYYPQNTLAPTVIEGWRLRTG
jgi:hypothetical protein